MPGTVQPTLGPMELQRVQEGSLTVLKSIQDWRALVPRALGRAAVSQKQAAADLGITPSQLSGQLAGRNGEHLSFWRMHGLPREFWAEILPLIADYHGLTLGDSPQQRNHAEIGRLVSEAVLRIAR